MDNRTRQANLTVIGRTWGHQLLRYGPLHKSALSRLRGVSLPLKALAILLVLTIVGTTQTAARDLSARPITNLYVFGDSLSDTGNLFALTGGEQPAPPYFAGRFSDGPVWVERLATLIGLDIHVNVNVTNNPLTNVQAIGGAFSGFGSEAGAPLGLLSQVENFATAGGHFERNDLVVIWIGANDYLSNVNADPLDVMDNIDEAIQSLSQLGGHRFLLVNLPNLGDTPFGTATGTVEALHLATAANNQLLDRKVNVLRLFSRLEVALFDANTLLQQGINHPEVFGFSNVTTPCLIQQSTGDLTLNPECQAEDGSIDSTGTLFWDWVHPTAGAHRVIAIAAYSGLLALQERARKPRWFNRGVSAR